MIRCPSVILHYASDHIPRFVTTNILNQRPLQIGDMLGRKGHCKSTQSYSV